MSDGNMSDSEKPPLEASGKAQPQSNGSGSKKLEKARRLIRQCYEELVMSKPSLTCNQRAAEAVEIARKKAQQEIEATTNDVEMARPPLATRPEAKQGVPMLTISVLETLVTECQQRNDYLPLVRQIGQIFSSSETLNKSFLRDDVCIGGTREHVDDVSVDVAAVQHAYELLFSVEQSNVEAALINAMGMLSDNIRFDIARRNVDSPNYCNQFVICMENPELLSPDYIQTAFPQFLGAMARLPEKQQQKLILHWSRQSPDQLRHYVLCLHQLITVKVIEGQFSDRSRSLVNDDQGIVAAVQIMNMIYLASLLGGLRQENENFTSGVGSVVALDSDITDSSSKAVVAAAEAARNASADENVLIYPMGLFGPAVRRKQPPPRSMKIEDFDQLYKMFGHFSWDCRHPLLDHEEFYNDALDDVIQLDQDFVYFKTEEGRFSFLNYPYVLRPATKVMGLFYDSRIRMHRERRQALLHMLTTGDENIPYLKLVVRRDFMIEDALVQLEMICQDRPHDLKKQLFIQFDGEQGVDEGGIQKEFFQLVVEELFNFDYGMFSAIEETQQCWFNPASFENDSQFTLIGIMLGLAVYNNIILDIHFPMVIYRKLMGLPGTFEDLQDSHPVLARSLKALLECDGDVEEQFMCTFSVSYADVLGSTCTYDLKENGNEIPVTSENRKEYVRLYADFILNKMIEKQFSAFKRGFDMVADESPLKLFFRPDELELIICGSHDFDFEVLEASTQYDGGFTSESLVIRWFWEVVHEMTIEQKRQLLSFSTGSDRVPVGGLSKLKFMIARNGPDSDRLPTAHTCFNVLMLADYSSKAKLQERLLKAITHTKGFGMI